GARRASLPRRRVEHGGRRRGAAHRSLRQRSQENPLMCGICGIARTSGGADPGVVGAMADALRHRGPDDQGLWSSPDRRVILGHRRLSIIDLSPAGHQPMTDQAGRLWISFNGEIYNYLELREEL